MTPDRVALIVGFVVGIAPRAGVAAQDAGRELEPAGFDSLETLPNTFSPATGTIGTRIALHVGDLPIAAPLRVGVGTRFGFEEVGWVMSDDDGEFDFTFEIPEAARTDVANFFIVFDPYFNPIGLTDPFHVTDQHGNVHREGRVLDAVAGCPALRGADGLRYALTGAVDGLRVGDRTTVTGRVTRAGACGTVLTIVVEPTVRP